jgi:hypothetical protein
MKYTYEIKKLGGEDGQDVIYRLEDGAWIPMDESNSDYQAYLNKDKVNDEAETI